MTDEYKMIINPRSTGFKVSALETELSHEVYYDVVSDQDLEDTMKVLASAGVDVRSLTAWDISNLPQTSGGTIMVKENTVKFKKNTEENE